MYKYEIQQMVIFIQIAQLICLQVLEGALHIIQVAELMCLIRTDNIQNFADLTKFKVYSKHVAIIKP